MSAQKEDGKQKAQRRRREEKKEQPLTQEEKEAIIVQNDYKAGTLFVYGVLQNNDVLQHLLNWLPEKEMALVLSKDIHGPYRIKDSPLPALSTVEIPFTTPKTDDKIILGQVRWRLLHFRE